MRVFFQKIFFFLKRFHLGRPTCLVLGRMLIRVALAFSSCLWGLPWTWEHACGHAIALVTCLRGLVWPWQHDHGGCLILGCLPIRVLFSQIRLFFFFFPKRKLFRQVSEQWPWQHSQPLLLSYGALLILVVCLCHGCFPVGTVIALDACRWACNGFGNVSTGAAFALAACPLKDYLGRPACLGFSSMPRYPNHAFAMATCP